MKRAKQSRLQPNLKPRNPLIAAALLKPAGAHQRKDKRAARARQRQLLKKEISEA